MTRCIEGIQHDIRFIKDVRASINKAHFLKEGVFGERLRGRELELLRWTKQSRVDY
jgi:hypothetical protein